jgi:hypothetical protein
MPQEPHCGQTQRLRWVGYAVTIKNEGKATRAINPIVNKDADGSIAKSKDEHTYIEDIRHIEVHGAILEEGEGENQEVTSQRNEGLNTRGNNNSSSIEKIPVSEHLSSEEKAELLELLQKYQEHFVTRPGNCNIVRVVLLTVIGILFTLIGLLTHSLFSVLFQSYHLYH